MKIEEVIKQLESILDHTRSMAASPDADDIWRKDIDALKFALTALRSMPEAGEPLNLEQLKQMDGTPVWIEDKEYPENTGWVIWDDSFKQNWLGDPETRNSHGKSWLAYSYPPAHIDRSEWISVKNKKLLPKIKERVLSRLWYPDIGEVVVENQYYGNGIWMGETDAITHWMPLPKPPKEGLKDASN